MITTTFIFIVAGIGAFISDDYYKESCAKQKYQLECEVIQNIEYCQKKVIPECLKYEDGEFKTHYELTN